MGACVEKNAWGCGDPLLSNRKVYATVFPEKWKARSLRECTKKNEVANEDIPNS